MRDQSPADADAAATQATSALAGEHHGQASQASQASQAGLAGQADQPRRRRHLAFPSARSWLAALGWAIGAAVIFALFFRITVSKWVDSDGANNALQAFD